LNEVLVAVVLCERRSLDDLMDRHNGSDGDDEDNLQLIQF
jgi:hypothetical protein